MVHQLVTLDCRMSCLPQAFMCCPTTAANPWKGGWFCFSKTEQIFGFLGKVYFLPACLFAVQCLYSNKHPLWLVSL